MDSSTTIRVATAEPEPESRPGAPSRKRPGEAASNDRAAKRRSSRACLSCRSRKVRCDVVNSGVPCTNCRLDDVDCVLKESSRGRKPNSTVARHRAASSTAPQSAGPAPQQDTSPHSHDHDADRYLVSLTFDDQQSGAQSEELAEDSLDGDSPSDGNYVSEIHLPCHHRQNSFVDPPGEMIATSVSPQRGQGSQPRSSHSHVPSHGGCSASRTGDFAPITLPPYIKPLPGNIGPRDLEYLAGKDAMTIPDDGLRDELLRTYVKVIHCFMPAINLDEFLDPIITQDASRPVSLLLFQAVMFAGVVFLDSNLLRSRGYSSRKSARKIFFNRVRLLYGLDCEPDRMALIQSLLLMTYWYDSPDDEKDTWYWMGNTLSLSQIMGLHRDPRTLNISVRAKKLRRRIWWSCFIRDRQLALAIRRPARIREEDFNVTMLELNDFDLCQPSKEQIDFVRTCGFTTVEEDGRKRMCQICIDLAKLCVCIGHILHTQYSVVPLNSESYKNIVVVPRFSDKQLSDINKCDQELQDWCCNQETTSVYAPPSPPASTFGSGTGEDCADWANTITRLHQALLRMVYLSALGALHRPHAFMGSSSQPDSTEATDGSKKSLRKVKEAAVEMTKLAFELQCENQLRYLPTSSIPAFLSATMIHMLYIRDPDEEVRNLSLGRFHQCFHALGELQGMYTAVDYALSFLESVLKRMGTNVAMLPIWRARKHARATTHSDDPPVALPHPPRGSFSNASFQVYNASAIDPRLKTPPITANDRLAEPVPNAMLQQAGVRQVHTNTEAFLELVHPINPGMMLGEGVPENHELLPEPPVRASPGSAAVTNHASRGLGPMPHDLAGGPHLMDTPSMNSWNEFDALLPALINFDATDLGSMESNQSTALSAGTPWQPFF
ncbi:uncharacterized protein E0L32_002986 [Thyridium curvatum]|uniref:Zn(2)-C6 fungal-type domain-containing protein n=1 Tax=Thyridium curvatum TaxID=1093900 RepID=A0A507B443_9PEZI|nr:uncharacterized protein E0L32_002986 [Thyridium curvatum]TPX17885.1 hypothetical protein E0L32_002986 [Thyridium curvatum]